ncbi:MAG: ThiF family adenylyltransferase [Bacteroidota bacterium]|nr:ThiF family adenylyltransferase [Bacteroidota bacterium]
MELQLRISGLHHTILQEHLLPEDGREAVAVAICGRHFSSNKIILTVHDITLIPHNECYSREFDILIWPTARILHYFDRLGKSDLAILKIHSHPGGYSQFSDADDRSDREFFDSAFGWALNDKPHASAVMLPGGKIFGRFFFDDLHHEPIDKVVISGDQIEIYQTHLMFQNDAFALRTIQAFGDKTYAELKKMTIGVIGCSGTGSPLIEQMVRLGVGKLILIDPDTIELKNLNRILNATRSDAELHRPKVAVIAEAIKRTGLGTLIECYQSNLYHSAKALQSLIECDLIFGCVDSVDGRYLLNQLCTFYLIPYFDLGVKLEANKIGGIQQICATVHYIQPGKSSLISRGVFTTEDLRAASQYRKNPEEYENLQKNSYIKNINVNNPAVISVNMQIASHAVNEFLNRIHAFKYESSNHFAVSTIDITGGYIVNVNEDDLQVDAYLLKKIGRGDVQPFIELPELSV